MASDSEARHEQRAVIEFLTVEEETMGNIHRRLKNVYGDCTVDKSTVRRWAKRVKSSERGNADLDDEPRSDQQGIQALVSMYRLRGKIVLVNKVCDYSYT
jgi:hypothetical protein